MKPDSTDTNATVPDALPPALLGPGRDEFPEGAGEFTDEPSRRRFLTLMSASIALAGGAGCNLRPASQRKILPYTTQPDEVTPGLPTFYASAAPLAGYGQGVLVRSNEGRPTKIEGNPSHTSSYGGAGVHALASVLDLYDPDRSRGVSHRGTPTSYELAVAAMRKFLIEDNGQHKNLKFRIVTETVTSPTLAGQIRSLLAAVKNARWVQYDAVSAANARAGQAKALGSPVNVTYDFLKADVVVSLDADFLCSGPGHVRYSRDFADRRKLRLDGKDAAEVAKGREPGKPFKEGVKSELADKLVNRLYAIETMPTNTGAVADHRLAIPTAEIESFARALAVAVGVAVPPGGTLSAAAQAWVQPLANDIDPTKKPERKGRVIVIAGDHLSPALHAIVMAINEKLGSMEVGATVKVTAPVEAQGPADQMMDLKALTGELAAKTADAVLILGGANPAYSAPADVDFAGALDAFSRDDKKFSLHLGSHMNETGVRCQWHVNEAHYLETWGDILAFDGTATIQQPLIAPLHGGRSAIELLATIMKSADPGVPASPRDPLDIVQATWRAWFGASKKDGAPNVAGAFEIFWQESVRAGVVTGFAPAPVAGKLAPNWAAGIGPVAPVGGDYELNFRACPALFDGRYANNGWLQELPKPLTKISWDNAAFLSPATAKKLDLPKVNFRWTAGEHGRAEVGIIEIDVGGKKVKAPAWVLPGHADGAITVHLGHGRTRAGVYAATSPDELNVDGQPYRGFNAYPLRSSTAPWAAPAKATRTSGSYFLACTQGHWDMAEKDPVSGRELDRKPVRRGTVSDFQKNPMFAKIPPMATGETEAINDNMPHPKGYKESHPHDERLHPLNMYAPAEGLAPGMREYQQRRWAMAIDLSACTGCSACVVACQSENNIPVVGKREVTRGREMYWINIDRYYVGAEGDPSAVQAYFQPRMCVQCENAPCEIVCPVGATVHSTDGLNDMTYNRCVGTRYCSNNCPYKVRRFNFLTFQDWTTDTVKLGRNPDVSVRSRGVMEKCTFCVQRIRAAEIVAERELAQKLRPQPDPAKGEVLIKDGEILTACQSACPSGAIVFGDINDPKAAVSRWKNVPSNYGLLAELNTRPRLTHMAVVRNPNTAMPKGA